MTAPTLRTQAALKEGGLTVGAVLAQARADVDRAADLLGLRVGDPLRRETADLTREALAKQYRVIADTLDRDLASAVTDLPIIASGGIMSGRDAIEFFMAGASAVQVGTATFRDPEAPWRVLAEIESWCESEGVQRLDEIIGVARRRD